jgi:hypothetical protein
MHSILSKPQEMLFSSIIFDSLTELLGKIDHFVDNQVVQRDQMAQEEGKTTKKPKFDDFFGGDEDSDDGGLIDFDAPAAPAAPKSKVKVEEVKQIGETEQKFIKIYEELLLSLVKYEAFGGLDLVDFLLKFKNIYCKDFFADDMATILMRQIYLETEIINQDYINELTAKKNLQTEGT